MNVKKLAASGVSAALFLMLWATTQVNAAATWPVVHFHFQKLEMKLVAWSEREQAHSDELRSSDHPAIANWRKQLEGFPSGEELTIAHFKEHNELINADISYIDDYSHYGVRDYWAAPSEALKDGGDCEDIALVKAAALSELGWPSARKHLLVGNLAEDGRHEPHAVLVIEFEKTFDRSKHFVLRSITNDVVPLSEYPMEPLYALDSEGVLVFTDTRR